MNLLLDADFVGTEFRPKRRESRNFSMLALDWRLWLIRLGAKLKFGLQP